MYVCTRMCIFRCACGYAGEFVFMIDNIILLMNKQLCAYIAVCMELYVFIFIRDDTCDWSMYAYTLVCRCKGAFTLTRRD